MLSRLCHTSRLSGALRPSLLSPSLLTPAAPATAGLAAATTAATTAAGRWRCFASITASEARQGHLVMIDGRRVEVTEFRLIKSGRGAASVSLSYVDLDSMKTGTQTLSAQKKLEKIDPEKQLLRVMYVDGDRGVVVMADSNFDEVDVPLHLFGGPSVAELLTADMQMGVLLHEGNPIKVNLPSEVLTLLRATRLTELLLMRLRNKK